MTQRKKKAFENIVGKEENASKELRIKHIYQSKNCLGCLVFFQMLV